MERICETLSTNLLDIFKEKEWTILKNLLDVAFPNEGQQEETKAEDPQKRIEKLRKRQQNTIPNDMRDEVAKKFEVFCETHTNKEFDPKKILSYVIKEVDHKTGRKKRFAKTKQMGHKNDPHYKKKKNYLFQGTEF